MSTGYLVTMGDCGYILVNFVKFRVLVIFVKPLLTMDKTSNPPFIKSCTKKELVDIFGVSYNTIVRWCDKIGINTEGGLMTPQRLQKFYAKHAPKE